MHKHYGFTIVEVLVVVLVLGILMTLGGLAWRAAREDAINNESKTELLTIQNAVEEYYSQNGEYPWPASCSKYSSATNRTCDAGELNPLLVPKYLKELPTDWRGKHYEYTVNKSPDNRNVASEKASWRCGGTRQHQPLKIAISNHTLP